jgi:uncharacterized protein YegP (UPF0339 family)
VDKVEFYKDVLGEWRWRYVRSNGEPMADSGEGYKNRSDAVSAAEYLFVVRDTANLTFTFADDNEGD